MKLLSFSFFFFLSLFVSFFLIFFSNFLSEKKNININKMMSFDCGFSSFKKSRIPFSIQFFLIGLVFIIFEIELIILITLISYFNFKILDFFFMMFFILFIFFGLLFEWKSNKLLWFF